MIRLDKKTLHHAYFFEGSRDEAVPFVRRFCHDKLGVELSGNPDFWFAEYETFTIDDSREVKALQEKRPMGEEPRVFFIALTFITGEAQNALLKIFEEPTVRTHFFITAPSAAILLPTLRSRLSVERVSHGKNDFPSARAFLAASLYERLKLVKPLAEKDTDEPKKSEALALLSELEVLLHQSLKKNYSLVKPLSELLLFKRFIFSRAPSIKMLTEYLSLTLPHVS